MIMRVTSKDGHDIRVESVRIWRTYLGLIEGYIPPDEWYARMVSNAEENTPYSVHVLQPETEADPDIPERRWLPPVAMQAEMTSAPLQDEWCGSALTVIWFENRVGDVPVTALVEKVVGDLCWADVSVGFDY